MEIVFLTDRRDAQVKKYKYGYKRKNINIKKSVLDN